MTDDALISTADRDRMAALRAPDPAAMTEADAGRAADDLAFVKSVARALFIARREAMAPLERQMDEVAVRYDRLLFAAADAESRIKEAILAWRATPTGPAPTPRAVAGAVGVASVQTTWTFEVVDAASVPPTYLTADTVAIGRAVRGGVREIPGVRIFARESIAGRRRV
jgi:hypothetical protein